MKVEAPPQKRQVEKKKKKKPQHQQAASPKQQPPAALQTRPHSVAARAGARSQNRPPAVSDMDIPSR